MWIALALLVVTFSQQKKVARKLGLLLFAVSHSSSEAALEVSTASVIPWCKGKKPYDITKSSTDSYEFACAHKIICVFFSLFFNPFATTVENDDGRLILIYFLRHFPTVYVIARKPLFRIPHLSLLLDLINLVNVSVLWVHGKPKVV